jgi:hypothetical protein
MSLPDDLPRGGEAPARITVRCGGSAIRPHELPAARVAVPSRSSEVSMHER